jgi:hypothetical protein
MRHFYSPGRDQVSFNRYQQLYLEDNGFIYRLKMMIAAACVDKSCVLIRRHPSAFVDVTEDVKSRLDPF